MFGFAQRLDAQAAQKAACDATGECGAVRTSTVQQIMWLCWYFVLGDGFKSWRVGISFGLCKMMFALSAFPFFPISMVGSVNTLFTHADPTAYTEDGQLTQVDPTGLSAYLRFLREDVLDASRFQDELATAFEPADVAKMRAALEDGERFLADVWSRPGGNIRKRCLKKKKEITKVIMSVITRKSASDGLYSHVFPNAVLVEQFEVKWKAINDENKKVRKAKRRRPR